MNRKWLCALVTLLLVVALAVPAAAQSETAHFAAYTVEYEEDNGGILTPLLMGMGVSGVICIGIASLQKDVHKKTGASDYITEEGVHFSHASDRYTHTTRTRRKLENNQNNKK